MLRPLKTHLNPETIAWAVSFGLLEAGTASCMAFLGVGDGLLLGWALLASAVFAAGEPGLFVWLWTAMTARDEERPAKKARATRNPSPSDSEPGSSNEDATPGPTPDAASEESKSPIPALEDSKIALEKYLEKLARRRSPNHVRAIEVAVAIVLAFLSVLGSHHAPAKMPPPSQTDLQHELDQLHSDLQRCMENTCSRGSDNTSGGGFGNGGDAGGGRGNGGNATLHLDPQFQQQLLDTLKQAMNQSNSSGQNSSGFGIGTLVLVILIVIGVAIAALLREKPEAAAPLGTIGLATVAIKEADHLSRMDSMSFWVAGCAFLAVLAMLVVLTLRRLWNKDRNGTTTATAGRSGAPHQASTQDYMLNALLSVLILLWIPLAVCYHYESKPDKTDPHPAQQKIAVTYKILKSVTGFMPFAPDNRQVQQLAPDALRTQDKILADRTLGDAAAQLAEQVRGESAKPGDYLLLFGSTDCSEVQRHHKITNQELASYRANALSKVMGSVSLIPAEHIYWNALPQGANCKKSADMRAVFPVLIKAAESDTIAE